MSIIFKINKKKFTNYATTCKSLSTFKLSDFSILTIDKDGATEIFGKDANYISSGNIELDIIVLMSCKKLISSNSTFCYWCGLLGNSDEIIVPKKLFSERGFSLPLTKKNNILI